LTKKKRKKKEFFVLGALVTALTIAVGVSGKAGGQIIEPPDKPPKPPRPPPDDREILCVQAGGIWNPQTQICELLPEKPPNGPGTGNGCPPLGELFGPGVRIMIGPNCGNDSRKLGVTTSRRVFQRPEDRICNDISTAVIYDDGGGNAWRRSETAPAGNCLFRAGATIGCGPMPSRPPGSGFYYVFNERVIWTPEANLVRAGGIVIFGAGFNAEFQAWLKCQVLAGDLP